MRLAIFSDVHGNPFACQAVLRAIAREGAFDAILAAGDLCLGGSDPAGCVEQLIEAGVQAVYGNTEQYLRFPDQIPPDELHRSMWNIVQPAAYWTLARLSSEQLSWIGGLPFERRFSPTSQPEDDLLVVHANPKDVEMMIYPSETEQLHIWGEVRQPDEAVELQQSLSGVAARAHRLWAFPLHVPTQLARKNPGGGGVLQPAGDRSRPASAFTLFSNG